MAVRSFCPAPGAALLLEVADGRGEISLGEKVTFRIFLSAVVLHVTSSSSPSSSSSSSTVLYQCVVKYVE